MNVGIPESRIFTVNHKVYVDMLKQHFDATCVVNILTLHDLVEVANCMLPHGVVHVYTADNGVCISIM